MKLRIKNFIVLLIFFIVGCASASNEAIKVEKSQSESSSSTYQGKRHPIMVGKFDNRSGFMRGIWAQGSGRSSALRCSRQ
jgi:curli biogenesis system outer membrane secretion channel CsgG